MICTGIKGEGVSGRITFLGGAIGQREHSKLGFPLNILYIFVSSAMIANRITQIAAISNAQ
jgi:hypothetical protein